MRGHVRTILAAVAVLALCLLLAVLSWQVLLGAFFLAGVGWAFWSLSKSSGKHSEEEDDRIRLRNRERAGSKRRKALRKGNVYDFPVKSQRDSASY